MFVTDFSVSILPCWFCCVDFAVLISPCRFCCVDFAVSILPCRSIPNKCMYLRNNVLQIRFHIITFVFNSTQARGMVSHVFVAVSPLLSFVTASVYPINITFGWLLFQIMTFWVFQQWMVTVQFGHHQMWFNITSFFHTSYTLQHVSQLTGSDFCVPKLWFISFQLCLSSFPLYTQYTVPDYKLGFILWHQTGTHIWQTVSDFFHTSYTVWCVSQQTGSQLPFFVDTKVGVIFHKLCLIFFHTSYTVQCVSQQTGSHFPHTEVWFMYNKVCLIVLHISYTVQCVSDKVGLNFSASWHQMGFIFDELCIAFVHTSYTLCSLCRNRNLICISHQIVFCKEFHGTCSSLSPWYITTSPTQVMNISHNPDSKPGILRLAFLGNHASDFDNSSFIASFTTFTNYANLIWTQRFFIVVVTVQRLPALVSPTQARRRFRYATKTPL